jgi:gliding motility-associated-like protein
MTDPVQVSIIPEVAFICPEDTATINLEVADGYELQWLPTEGLSCNDCSEVEATPDENIVYSVTATTPEGCISVDSVLVNVIPCEQVIDTTTCANDSILIFGKNFFPGVPDTVSIGDDSILLVNVEPIDTVLELRDTLICFGDSVVFDGVTLSGGEEAAFVYTQSNGCDSTIVLSVSERPLISDTTAVSICQGDTASVFGSLETVAGLYSAQFTAVSGCDSIHYIQLTVLDTPSVDIPVALLSCETGSGTLLATGTGGAPPYDYEWDNGATGMENEGLAPGNYTVTVGDAMGCTTEGVGLVLDSLPTLELQLTTDSASCFGAMDGILISETVSGGTPPYRYSLDGEVYQSSSIFTGLPAGVYTLYLQDAEACLDSFPATIGAPPPLTLALPPDTTLQLGESLDIVPTYGGLPDFFSWQPPLFLNCMDCPIPTATPTQTTRYQLTIGNGDNCTLTEAITIFVEKPRRVYIPNAVSPNDDGVNDGFRLYPGTGVERILSTRIFSRWGELVFEAENYVPDNTQPTWDGTFRGEKMQSAVFTYVIEVQFVDGVVVPFTGALYLVR